MKINESSIYHLKDKIKNDLEVMMNCLRAEQRKLYILKNLAAEAQQYEICAKLREIEKCLEEVKKKIEEFN